MRQKIFLTFILLISLTFSAQTKGIVVDENNKPIPYVNIWVENENIGTTSEENGQFSIAIDENNKILVFSGLGFETRNIKVSEAAKVIMKAVVFQLDEVFVSKPKNIKQIEVGKTKKQFYLPEPQISPWIFAKIFKYDASLSATPFIKNATFFIKSQVEEGMFRLRIFSVKEDGFPGEDVISEEILVKVKKGKSKTVVDLSSYNLQLPKEGIFVGFEKLIVESNKYSQEGVILNSKRRTHFVNYGPHIMYHYMDYEGSYAFGSGYWQKQLFRHNSTVEKKRVISPAINITLTN